MTDIHLFVWGSFSYSVCITGVVKNDRWHVCLHRCGWWMYCRVLMTRMYCWFLRVSFRSGDFCNLLIRKCEFYTIYVLCGASQAVSLLRLSDCMYEIIQICQYSGSRVGSLIQAVDNVKLPTSGLEDHFLGSLHTRHNGHMKPFTIQLKIWTSAGGFKCW